MAQKRAEMIEETRAKLISAARAAFATVGYADSSMDELTAQAGLTRGALYHHFGGKKGLLEAVIAQIDAEISGRLAVIVEEAESTGRLRSGVHWLHQDGRRARSPADRPAGRASGSGRSLPVALPERVHREHAPQPPEVDRGGSHTPRRSRRRPA